VQLLARTAAISLALALAGSGKLAGRDPTKKVSERWGPSQDAVD
jgi:hypothetical protein